MAWQSQAQSGRALSSTFSASAFGGCSFHRSLISSFGEYILSTCVPLALGVHQFDFVLPLTGGPASKQPLRCRHITPKHVLDTLWGFAFDSLQRYFINVLNGVFNNLSILETYIAQHIYTLRRKLKIRKKVKICLHKVSFLYFSAAENQRKFDFT